MMKKRMPCIICPMSCHLEVALDDQKHVIFVSGNHCPRGPRYAEKELTAPMRVVTTTVRILRGTHPLLPVITTNEVPKARMFDIIKEAKKLRVEAPILCGEVICHDIAGLGVDLIATRTMDEVDVNETKGIAGNQRLERI